MVDNTQTPNAEHTTATTAAPSPIVQDSRPPLSSFWLPSVPEVAPGIGEES